SHTSSITSYNSAEELPDSLKKLLSKAKNNLGSSYSPYSGFQVSAAIELINGTIVLGSNQENIAYPSGLCAERVAIFSAGTNYPKETIKTIAITASSINGEVNDPVTPCGACRQVMIEIEHAQNKEVTVIMSGINGEVWVANSVKDLIPFYFTSDKVNKI
ncbi:MAG: cytidine deaminase, partial [Salibacteraceae bacterium]